MGRGRSNKLVGQAGEYLVAAELCRRGMIATTFTGNVPHYDIIASNEKGQHVAVQVKTSRSASWQLATLEPFFDVELLPETRQQVVGRLRRAPVRGLMFVFVQLGEGEPDRFFVLPWKKLAQIIRKHHADFLSRYDGTRPKRWDSLHTAVSVKQLSRHENHWEAIEEQLD